MSDRDLLQEIPSRRIKPIDGMTVTARVWEEAHEYHRQRQRFHALLSHEPGILSGLEVIASDPADSSIYILPGIALDSRGETIVLNEPVAYDIGSAHGVLYLLLTLEESPPMPDSDEEDGPLYVHAHFGIEAVASLPDTRHVELARIRRRDRESPLVDAQDAEQPGWNEIDLRFRRTVRVVASEIVSLAVCSTGGLAGAQRGHGASDLARALRQSGRRVWVDEHVPLAPGLEAYTVVYLLGQDAFQLNRDEMNALYAYLQGGGTVLVESCREGITEGNPPADASFSDLLASMGVQLEELQGDHPLLFKPHLFATPPPGFETEGTPGVMVGEGLIMSTCDYGCLWQGKRRGRVASREEIRSAIEWGDNVVAYALARRREKREM